MRKEKDYAISLIRFIAMILILCCHSFETIGYTIGVSNKLGIIGNYCAVGVQVFLIISGYLYGSRKNMFQIQSRIEFILSRMKKVLLDYYIYIFMVIIPVYYLLSPGTINVSSIWKLITCSGTIWGVHHLWFIPYILAAYFLTPILFDYKKLIIKNGCSLTKILCAMFGLMFTFELLGRAYNSYFIMAWINCYILGFFLPNIRERIDRKNQKRAVAILFIFSMLTNYYKLHVRYELLPTLEGGIEYELCNYYINYSRVLFALTIFFVVVLFGEFAARNYFFLPKRVLEWSDKYSYGVYITHMIFAKGVLSVLSLTSSYTVNVMIMLILTAVSAMVLFYLCELLKKNLD